MNIRRTFLALGAMILGVGFLGAFPQQAQAVTCTDYRQINPAASTVYPNDGHYFVCGTFTPVAMSKVLQGPQGLPSNIRTLLHDQGVTYYFFANRADNNTYMSGTLPYSLDPMFQTSTARCANTYYSANSLIGRPIAVSIFNTCQFASSAPINPNLQGITLHETGHAFDFSIGKRNGSATVTASNSKAYKDLFAKSVNSPTAASDLYFFDNGDKTHAKPATCGTFSQGISDLELDLGIPTAISTPVCTGSTVNQPFQGLKNSDIAKKQSPYFVSPSVDSQFRELFAAQFALKTGRIGSPDPLPFIDSYVTNVFRCTYIATVAYYNTLNPPSSNTILQQNNCPLPAAGDWTMP